MPTAGIPRPEPEQPNLGQIVVRAQLDSASAETVEARVTTPLELALMHLPDLQHVHSRTQDGATLIQLTFSRPVGPDDLHAVDRAVATLQPSLPPATRLAPAALETALLP